jgi:hypothetical protein
MVLWPGGDAGAHPQQQGGDRTPMTQQGATEAIPEEPTGTNGARARGDRRPANRRAAEGKDDVTAHLLTKLESVHQELGRERLLREQIEADAAHKLQMAHERIRDLEERLDEQEEVETALLSARQRVADLEVQLAVRHEGRRNRRRSSGRAFRWWMFGR